MNVIDKYAVLERLGFLPMFYRGRMDKLAEQPLLPPRILFPTATFAWARKNKNGRRLPQAIAHRGYKAKFAENTMSAFAAAVKVGAQALETDIHLSKDGVVVLSHDATLERCYGKPQKIIDCNWSYLSTLRTLREPHDRIPRLLDLLKFLAQSGQEETWLLLDIKLDDNADDIMRLIGETIRQVPPIHNRPWNQRVVLGIWATKYLPLCDHYLPDFPISHISFSTSYSRQFLAHPHVSFNMLQMVLQGPCGPSFLRRAREAGRQVFAWTVNDDRRMRWCIRKQLDGCITDDPKRFLEVCAEWEGDGGVVKGEEMWWPMGIMWEIVKFNFLVFVFGVVFRLRYGRALDRRLVRAGVEE